MYSFIRPVAFVRLCEWARKENREANWFPVEQRVAGWSRGWQGQAGRDLSTPRGVQVAPTQLRFIAPKREKNLPCQSLFAQLCVAQKAGKG